MRSSGAPSGGKIQVDGEAFQGISKVDSSPEPPNQCCTTGNTQTGKLATPNLGDGHQRSRKIYLTNPNNALLERKSLKSTIGWYDYNLIIEGTSIIKPYRFGLNAGKSHKMNYTFAWFDTPSNG